MSFLIMSLQCLGSIELLFLLLISCKLIIISLNYLTMYTGQTYLPKKKRLKIVKKWFLTCIYIHIYIIHVWDSKENLLICIGCSCR